jgi:uncharacterized delta-60 repeat protein
VKYDSDGVEQWEARYNGPGNDWDDATALVLDSSGNIYVTGNSSGFHTDFDYATVKYNAAGVQQWVARYNGPGNDWDMARALAVDTAGNVYVTGYSSGSGIYDGYATVKYNSAGVEQWVARYSGPGNFDDRAKALTVDGSGNVYVTGASWDSGFFYDYATVKYNSAGVEQWVVRYDGPGNSYDRATALALDRAGNVYVTGASWDSGTSRDYATVKYDSDGVEQWEARYNGPGNGTDQAVALAVDGSGNVYVTGESWYSGFSYDYATVKYNSAGVEQWVARYSGPENDYDEARALAVDGSGNVYVTGSSSGSGTYADYVTAKYNSAGEAQWVVRYDGPGNSHDRATALVVDGSGNVYVTGQSSGSAFASGDYATVKYNAAGVEQWSARYNGPGNFSDGAVALAVDGSGNVYVTGYSSGSDTFPFTDYATVKYNSAGVQQWVARYDSPGNSNDGANALALDGSGNVYVSGSSRPGGTAYDYVTVKYNPAGVEQWVARYDGSGNSNDVAAAMGLDGSGNVYVTGYRTGSGWNVYTTIKYIQTPTGGIEIPGDYRLLQNYPNPFNSTTTIRFDLPQAVPAKISVYNALGQQVAVLMDEYKPAQYHQVVFDGREFSSGIYFYRLSTPEFQQARKMLLVR